MNPKFEQILQEAASSQAVYLYGAGIVAYGIAEALEAVWGITIQGYIVSDEQGRGTYCGKLRIPLAEMPLSMRGSLILIATPEVYHEEIMQRLRGRGCLYRALGYRVVYGIMSRYYRKTCQLLGLGELHCLAKGKPPTRKRIKVFMAISAKDRPLKSPCAVPPGIIKVQAGAAISPRLPDAAAYDDVGQTISMQNGNYSELTVTYWAWKNQRADYKGICHYRRVLDLGGDDLRDICAAGIDAVLPLPYLCYGDTSFQYRRYVPDGDIALLLSVLAPHEGEAVARALAGRRLYNHNLVLAKEAVFDAYCQWMFPILGRVEERCREQGMHRCDRYAGYLGELLTSVYFTEHARELCIVHVPELWMV